MCLDAGKLYLSTKRSLQAMSPNIWYLWKFLSITNCARISWVFLSRFQGNRWRTHRDTGNSLKTAQNSRFLIRAFGTAISCNKSAPHCSGQMRRYMSNNWCLHMCDLPFVWRGWMLMVNRSTLTDERVDKLLCSTHKVGLRTGHSMFSTWLANYARIWYTLN
jgi:hypothetical protein